MALSEATFFLSGPARARRNNPSGTKRAAGYGCGIVIGERPLRQPSAELPGRCDDDALGAADVTRPGNELLPNRAQEPLGSCRA